MSTITKDQIKHIIKQHSKFMIVNNETKHCITQEGFDELAQAIHIAL